MKGPSPLPPNRYFQRHHLPPAGLTIEVEPTSIEEFKGFPPGLAKRTAVSVKGIWGQLTFRSTSSPKVAPKMGATVVGRHGTMPDTISGILIKIEYYWTFLD